MAANVKQAQIAFNYCKAVFEDVPLFAGLVRNITADTITELIATGRTPDLIAPFTPARFSPHLEPARSEGGVSQRTGRQVEGDVHRHEEVR